MNCRFTTVTLPSLISVVSHALPYKFRNCQSPSFACPNIFLSLNHTHTHRDNDIHLLLKRINATLDSIQNQALFLFRIQKCQPQMNQLPRVSSASGENDFALLNCQTNVQNGKTLQREADIYISALLVPMRLTNRCYFFSVYTLL